jgi:hypothetical protein
MAPADSGRQFVVTLRNGSESTGTRASAAAIARDDFAARDIKACAVAGTVEALCLK